MINAQSLAANYTNEVGVSGKIRFLKNIAGLWLLQECRKAWKLEGREYSYEDLTRLLELAGTLGCGCVVVPIWGRTRNLPGIATGRTRDEDEAIFVDAVSRLGRTAERFGSRLFIEPINRYQNDVCVTVADALRLRQRIDSAAVFVMADVFHMNIEEADLGAAIVAAGKWLGHVHLADSNRLEPGKGHLDLQPVFDALARIGYGGYASFELAALSGDPDAVLPASVVYVRERLRASGIE